MVTHETTETRISLNSAECRRVSDSTSTTDSYPGLGVVVGAGQFSWMSVGWG